MLWAVLLAVTTAPSDLSAVGVVLTRQPEHAVAVLRSQGASRVVRVGENAFGGRVLSVASDIVAMDFGGERIQIQVRAGSASAGASRPVAAATSDSGAPARTMMRTEVQRRIADETQSILRETAIAP